MYVKLVVQGLHVSTMLLAISIEKVPGAFLYGLYNIRKLFSSLFLLE